MTVTFSPVDEGEKSATLSISHDAAGSPLELALTGTGTEQPPEPAPIINLSVTVLEMEDTKVGGASEITFTIGNSGDAELVVSDIAVTGDDGDAFTVSATTFTVQPGESVPVMVSFTPDSEGEKSASLSIVHGAETPAIVALSGTGVFSGIKAMFDADPVSGSVGVTVQFTDRSAGEVNSWVWDFGDGIGSEDQSPAHTYTADGSLYGVPCGHGSGRYGHPYGRRPDRR